MHQILSCNENLNQTLQNLSAAENLFELGRLYMYIFLDLKRNPRKCIYKKKISVSILTNNVFFKDMLLQFFIYHLILLVVFVFQVFFWVGRGVGLNEVVFNII